MRNVPRGRSRFLRFAAQGRAARRALTIVELLVVVAIVAMLVGLSLHAINAARESGRRAQCMNNIRQLTLAAIAHESGQGFFPSGGWGDAWAPIPGRFGPSQPGSWVWALLPFLERNDLAESGFGASQTEQEANIARVLQTPLPVTQCPSRRQVRAYPIFYPQAGKPWNAAAIQQAARCDYAINAGDQSRCEVMHGWDGPQYLTDGDDPKFVWPDVTDHTGISYLRSRITMGHLLDGASRTYCFGEKVVDPAGYETGEDIGDDFSMYNGYQCDTHRVAYWAPRLDGHQNTYSFGSAHPTTWNAAFADGRVRALSYHIDLTVHRSLANRRDGTVFGDDSIR